MVLMCGPVFEAFEHVASQTEGDPHRVLLTPQGKRLTQRMVEQLAQEPWLVLFCGHYEGFDERIRLLLRPRELSVVSRRQRTTRLWTACWSIHSTRGRGISAVWKFQKSCCPATTDASPRGDSNRPSNERPNAGPT